MSEGVYPLFLVATKATPSNERCYFEGLTQGACFSAGILADQEETQAPIIVRGGKGLLAPGELHNFKNTCKVMIETGRCLIPKPGYITNLENSLRTAFYPGSYTLSDFQNLREGVKKSMREYTNNVGTKYLVACPISCKLLNFESFFVRILIIFRWNL